MSLYSEDQQEAVYIRKQARLWKRSGLITEGQEEQIFSKADPGLKQTNIFFRIIFLIFTFAGTTAAASFFIFLFSIRDPTVIGVVLVAFALPTYILAEFCVRKFSLYRYGIEEALSLNAIAMLCYGAGMVFFREGMSTSNIIASLAASACSFAVYYRFGFTYAPLIGVGALCSLAVGLLPDVGWRGVTAAVLGVCFIATVFLSGGNKKDFRREMNELFQAAILTALYFTINLQVGNVLDYALPGQRPNSVGAGHGLYGPLTWWGSYVLTILIPAAMIYLGLKRRMRLVLDAGAILFVVSLTTNKSYLGMERYVWDPALLGAVLVSLSWFAARWLAQGKDGMRSGFTARDILKPEVHGIDLAALSAAMVPAAIPSMAPPKDDGGATPFAGGSSGGGGAESGF